MEGSWRRHSGRGKPEYFIELVTVNKKAAVVLLLQLRSKALELFVIMRAALWQPPQKCTSGMGRVVDPTSKESRLQGASTQCAVEQQHEVILMCPLIKHFEFVWDSGWLHCFYIFLIFASCP